jgi:hypothetical protein
MNMLSYGPPFSICIHDESWTLGKPYGIKLRCYWESLGNNFGTWGTPWEQDENTFGNKGKNNFVEFNFVR